MRYFIVLVILVLHLSDVLSQELPYGARFKHIAFEVDSLHTVDSLNTEDSTLFAVGQLKRQQEFIMGWQWTFLPRIVNRRFNMNFYQRSWNFNDAVNGDWQDSSALNWYACMPNGHTTTLTSINFGDILNDFRANSMQYDPEVDTVPVIYGDTTNIFDYSYNWNQWNPPTVETNHAAFGLHKTINSPKYASYGMNRYLVLDSTVSTSDTTLIKIIDGASPNNVIYRDGPFTDTNEVRQARLLSHPNHDKYSISTGNVAGSEAYNRNGSNWYVSIKLRRISTHNVSLDTIKDTVPVLRIVLPYVRNSMVNDSIKFSTVPRISAVDVVVSSDMSRGVVDSSSTPVLTQLRYFDVTRNMIPVADSGDITLSAYFTCAGGIGPTDNPKINTAHDTSAENLPSIRNLDIRVYYRNTAAVAIDWIRIETPFARSTFRGYNDTALARRLYEQTHILAQRRDTAAARALATGDTACGASNMRIWRIYGWDEVDSDNPQRPITYKKMHQYWSILLDTLFHTEGGGYSNYVQSVPQLEYWAAGDIPLRAHQCPGYRNMMKVPDDISSLGGVAYRRHYSSNNVRGGYDNRNPITGIDGGVSPNTYWGSDYDKIENATYTPPNPTLVPDGSEKYGSNFQEQLDVLQYRLRYWNSMLLYSNTPWWYNVFSTSGGKIRQTSYPDGLTLKHKWIWEYAYDTQPITGEEMRMIHWTQIASGCKGFVYDWGDPVHNDIPHDVDTSIYHAPDLSGYVLPDSIATSNVSDAACTSSISQSTYGWKFSYDGALADDSLYTMSPPHVIPDTGAGSYYSTTNTWYTKALGTKFLLSNAQGSDYVYAHKDSTGLIDTTYDMTNINKYIEWNYNVGHNIDDSVRTLGIDPTRYYLGRKSNRYEVMKIHDWIMSPVFSRGVMDTTFGSMVGALLMRLRLRAWQNFGYIDYGSCSEDKQTLLPTYGRFFSLNKSDWLVEKLDSCNTIDSTKFVQYSVHSVTNPLDGSEISLDSVYALCVVNRSMGPLLWPVGMSKSCDTRDTNQIFCTSYDFDSLVNAGVYGRYDQGGAREITIPFQYSNIDASFLLHVRQIGVADTNETVIDTVICPHCSLTCKYKPGEGKMFLVQTVKATEKAVCKGNLEFSGQHKLVVRPVLVGADPRSGEPIYDSTRVRYHLVYHKQDTMPGTGGFVTRERVYYSRSKILDYCQPLDEISLLNGGLSDIWDTTYVVSDSIIKFDSVGIPAPMVYSICKYPSLVVEYNTDDDVEYAHIVFACQDMQLTNQPLLIVESQRSTSNDTGQSIIIFKSDSVSTLETYGHPVINAVKNRNYYAFSTPHHGIVAATRWSTSWYRRIFDCDTISWFKHGADTTVWSTADVFHPSVNTYSAYGDDNECALVWLENNRWKDWSEPEKSENQVYYTQLKYTGFSLIHKLPSTSIYLNIGNDSYSSDSSIMRVSYYGDTALGDRNNDMPTVSRYTYDHVNYHDVVAWSSVIDSSYLGYSSCISLQPISVSVGCTGCAPLLRTQSILRVFGVGSALRDPGLATTRTELGSFPVDNVFSLDYEEQYVEHQIQHVYVRPWGFMDYVRLVDESSQGHNVQQAQNQYIRNDYSQRQMRRVYNEYDLIPNENIIEGAQYYFKGASSNQSIPIIASGFQSSTRRMSTGILMDHFSNDYARWIRSQGHFNSDVDTLYSTWFRVATDRPMKMYILGSNASDVGFKVINCRTGESEDIDLDTINTGFSVRSIAYDFTNGGDDYYKLAMYRKFPSMTYVEDLVNCDNSLIYGRTIKSESRAMDLSSTLEISAVNGLSVFPNPASDYYTIKVESESYDLPRKQYKVEMISELGENMDSYIVRGGTLKTIDVKELASGVYTLKISEIQNSNQEGVYCTSAKVVIAK